MKSKSRIKTIQAVSGMLAVLMLLNFIFFVFRVVSPIFFWILTGIIALIAFIGLPKIRKIFT